MTKIASWAALENAGLIDSSSLQLIAFRVEPLAPGAYAPLEAPERAAAASSFDARREAPKSDSALMTALVFGALVGIALLGWFFLRQSQRPRLSFEQHQQLAERISRELTPGFGGGVWLREGL